MTMINSKSEPPIWSCDTGQQIPCFVSCQLNHNKDVQYQRSTYCNRATILFFKVLG